MTLNFFDYLVSSPMLEIQAAFDRTDAAEDLGNFGSLHGRAVCLLRIATHTASIVLKPVFYLSLAITNMIVIQLIFLGIMPNEPHNKAVGIDKDVLIFENNPELKSRMFASLNDLMLTAPAAILSQIIQTVKAALGVLYPGIYFRKDELSPLLHRVARIARDVHCQQDLIEELEKGAEAITLDCVNKSYFQAEYIRDLTFIVTRLENPIIPDSRKVGVLSMLNPDHESGIKACPAGLGRILQQMCAAIEVPNDPALIIPHLLTQFKSEILNKMILDVEHDLEKQGLPRWKTVLRRIGLDPAHRGTALISAIGRHIALPDETIARADQDYLVASQKVQLSLHDHNSLIEEFNQRFSRHNKVTFLKACINSHADGSPGLRRFREQAIEAFTPLITKDMLIANGLEDGDEVMYIITQYQENHGQGNPSGNPGFNDLNDQAIALLLDRPNLFPTI